MSALKDKVAVVTGGARGIGRSVCLKLAQAGAALVVNDLDQGPAEELCSAMRRDDVRAIVCAGDVCNDDFPQRLARAAQEGFGRADIIVNNAGYVWNGPLDRMTDAQWDAMQAVHLRAPFRILRAFHPLLVSAHKRAEAEGDRTMRKIVNVSSVSATGGSAGQSAYASAKAGLHGLTRSLAKEWGRLGVTVNCVAFGYVETRLTQRIDEEITIDIGGARRRVGLDDRTIEKVLERTALGRAATPEEAAGAVSFFCRPESDFVTGQVLEVSGGLAN